MPVTRTFRGRKVLRTLRTGGLIQIVFGGPRGAAKERQTVPFAEFEAEVRRVFTPPRRGR